MAWLEVRQTSVEEKGWYDSAIFPRQPCLQADRLLVADQPGLGIEVDEQALQAAVCSGASEQPQWSRRDGSPTNW
jgi:galactonate dehydratase